MKNAIHAVAVISLLLLGAQKGFAQFQEVCFNQTGETSPTAYVIPDPKTGCSIVRLTTAGYTQLGASMIGDDGDILSGVLTGDFGSIQGTAQLSTPCTEQIYNQGAGVFVGTVYTPGVHVLNAVFTSCRSGATFSGQVVVVATPPPPSSQPPPQPCGIGAITLIDPVASRLLSGNSITTDVNKLANATGTVQGVAADGYTQVVVRVVTNDPSTMVTLTVINDQLQPSNSVVQDGGLSQGGGINVGSSTVNVPSQATNLGPMAFAVYRAPANFYRNSDDATIAKRLVNLEAQCTTDAGTVNTATPVSILRPPIVLIHGLWSNSFAWANFAPDPNSDNGSLWSALDKGGYIFKPDYSNIQPPGAITSSIPTYSQSTLNRVRANSLGFSFNAAVVFANVQQDIQAFRSRFGVAAVQADIVAHSMGGDISRAVAGISSEFSNNNFANSNNYGQGYFHKLITIGTPHMGTPLAQQLLDPANGCFRKSLALAGSISLQAVTISGFSVNGAIADLEPGSDALNFTAQQFPVAYIAGLASQEQNLSGLTCVNCLATALRACLDPLSADLTPQNWPTIFLPDDSDAIVPVPSQLNVQTGSSGSSIAPFGGIIHSAGIEGIGFNGPSELEASSGISDEVVNLLNESSQGTDFQH